MSSRRRGVDQAPNDAHRPRRALLVLGASSCADVEGSRLPAGSDHRFVDSATQLLGLGSATLFVDDLGDVYIAR